FVDFSQLVVIAPPRQSIGNAALKIVNINSKTSTSAPNAYRYVNPISLSTVGPLTGSSLGGTQVKIAGSGFLDDMYVTVAGSPARFRGELRRLGTDDPHVQRPRHRMQRERADRRAGAAVRTPRETVKLNVPANFSFPSTVNSHGWYLLAPFRWSPREQVLRRAEVVGGKAVDLTISFSDGRTSPSAPRGVEPRVPRGGADEDVRPSIIISGARDSA